MDVGKLSGAIQQAQQRFQKADLNADGAISRAEFDQANAANGGAQSADKVFETFDADGDGALSQDELRAGVQAKIQSAVQAAAQGGGLRGAAGAAGAGAGAQNDLLGALLETTEAETDETDPNAQYNQQIEDALNEDPRVKPLSFNGLVNKVV